MDEATGRKMCMISLLCVLRVEAELVKVTHRFFLKSHLIYLALSERLHSNQTKENCHLTVSAFGL